MMLWNRVDGLSLDELEEHVIETGNFFSSFGKKIYFTDDVPSFPFHAIKCKGVRVGFSILAGGQLCRDYRYTSRENGAVDLPEVNPEDKVMPVLRAINNTPKLGLIKTYKYFCDVDGCSMLNGGSLLYRDSNHLNILGSKYLARKILQDNKALNN